MFQWRGRRLDPRNLLSPFVQLNNARLEFAHQFAQQLSLRMAAVLDPCQICHPTDHRSIDGLVNVNQASEDWNAWLGVTGDLKAVPLFCHAPIVGWLAL